MLLFVDPYWVLNLFYWPRFQSHNLLLQSPDTRYIAQYLPPYWSWHEARAHAVLALIERCKPLISGFTQDAAALARAYSVLAGVCWLPPPVDCLRLLWGGSSIKLSQSSSVYSLPSIKHRWNCFTSSLVCNCYWQYKRGCLEPSINNWNTLRKTGGIKMGT